MLLFLIISASYHKTVVLKFSPKEFSGRNTKFQGPFINMLIKYVRIKQFYEGCVKITH